MDEIVIIPGVIFDTAFEKGCKAVSEPDPFGNFMALDSDNVLCEFHLDMVWRTHS